MGKNRRWLAAAVALAVARTAVTTGSRRAARNYTEENAGHSQAASATPGAGRSSRPYEKQIHITEVRSSKRQ